MSNTFDAAFQNKVLTMALRDPVFAQRVDGLLDPRYFDFETHSYLIDLANRHFATYKQPPSGQIVIKALRDAKTAGLVKDEFVDDVKGVIKVVYSPVADLSNREWTVDEVSKFCRQRAMEAAIERSIDILEKGGDFTEIDTAIKQAQSVGAHEGTGSVSYFENIKDRVKARIARLSSPATRGITTGHREIDDLLFHKGWGRKELNVLMGGAKSGKSMALQHFALKACWAGYQVLYITLENSKEVTQDRMDAAVAGVPMKDLDVNGATIETAVENMSKAGGCLEIHEFPGGLCKASDIRRLLEKYKANGIQFDMLVVDYADEMAAERRYNDERFAFKEIYQGLRALGIEFNLAVLTATQTNRAGNKAVTATSTDVSEDFNKVRLADVLMTLNATDEEKKMNQGRIYFAAMRNSEGGITVHVTQDRSRQTFITKVLKVA